jgi:phage shock protein C
MQPPPDHGFYRSPKRVIGGVCAGLADNFHVDPIWVRLAFVLLAFAQGIGVLLYVILWIVMPERGRPPSTHKALNSIAADLRRGWEEVRHQFGGSAASPQSATPAPAPPAAPPSSASPPPPSQQPDAAAPPSTIPVQAQPANQNWAWLFGVILIAVGLVYLAINSGLVDWSVIWPAILIGLGVLLLVRNLGRRP